MTQLKTTRRRPTRVLWRPLHYNAGLSGNLYKWGIQTPVIALAEECNLAEKVIKHFVGLSFLYLRCKPGVELAVGGCREIHPTHKQVKDAPLRPGGAAIRIIVESLVVSGILVPMDDTKILRRHVSKGGKGRDQERVIVIWKSANARWWTWRNAHHVETGLVQLTA
ncbi:hypothetical protein T4E_456 [Trichinella pseudospiralis]|uniref:Uncharacterized protein n=1 Tax=Trichinella pseudospiralis TaxID=6337 RepID=A0A0V0XJB8_TRIPS|nr:hypothetical protein T4E_456 [Trichinella pseudospiralis]